MAILSQGKKSGTHWQLYVDAIDAPISATIATQNVVTCTFKQASYDKQSLRSAAAICTELCAGAAIFEGQTSARSCSAHVCILLLEHVIVSADNAQSEILACGLIQFILCDL